MRVNGVPFRTVWMEGGSVRMIDQNRLPFDFSLATCPTWRATARAIREMTVRGAPAIGAAAGYAMAQAFGGSGLHAWRRAAEARRGIERSRPTARDLFAATARVWSAAEASPERAREAAHEAAEALAEESVRCCLHIGGHGEGLIHDGAQVLTHCNAGWLATVDFGTALAPVYRAEAEGRRLHVWVAETRPRAQGARLTAWELGAAGIPHTVVADTAAAHLLSRGAVDLVLVGADRVAANGDFANKVGTLERAVCAREFGVPFYVAAPPSTFDAATPDGDAIPIEERSSDEVSYVTGLDEAGTLRRVRVTAPGSPAYNPAFDVTPARFVTAFVTDTGLLAPDQLARPSSAPLRVAVPSLAPAG